MSQKIIRFLGTFLLVSINIFPVYAQEQADLLDTLLIKSGIYKQFEQIPAYVVQAQMEQRRASGAPTDQLETVSKIFNESFQPDALLEYFKSALKDTIGVEDIRGVLKWLESPLGSRITALEEQAANPENQIKMQEEAEQLFSQPERVEMAERFDIAVNATNGTIQTIENMAIAASMTEISSLDATSKTSRERMRFQIREGVNQSRDLYKTMTTLSMLYSYKNLTDEEWMAYIHFAESDIGKRYYQAMMKAMDTAFVNATEKMVEGIQEHCKEGKGGI